ncbi:MAG TPA: hypothetical protein PK156_17860 [Polyangium sp.]|nr:hypothetical protein [Polyangium sp.]
MLFIRPAQKALFAQQAVDRFVQQMIEHIREHLPRHYDALGADGARQAVLYGIERARSYRIESEAGARVFIQLMFVLGPRFDVDPRLPWAAHYLTAEDDERSRVSALLAAATEYMKESGVSPGREA